MATYLSLEEAAQKLGIPADRLVELRNGGQIRGFRDGTSWKFPDTEIDRLADELGDDLGGSGMLVDEQTVGAPLTESSGNIIGGDAKSEEGSGSDLELGDETLQAGSDGSDVNLVPTEGNGSDVAVVASDSGTGSDVSLASDSDLMLEGGSDLVEIDSAELQLDDPALMHDSAQLDLSVEPNAGSTGPVTDQELKEIAESGENVLSDKVADGADASGSMLDLGAESGELPLSPSSDLSFAGAPEDEDSGEELLGGDDSAMDVLGGDSSPGSNISSAGVSSLELMDELDGPRTGGSSMAASRSSLGQDVLSELDILGGEKNEGSALSGLSGMATSDSENLLASSGLGSSIGADALGDDSLSGIDDALADDDDLVIADDDDDLVLSSAGSDLSVAGDSGINLMSPSDSGLSLESEPLDLAGSSISALDLGAELDSGGSGSGGGSSGSGRDEGSGSMVDFQADEEFQLSPSGVGLEADFESGSQVIEVEDSEAIGEPVEFGDAMGDDALGADDALGGDVFGGVDGADAAAADALGLGDEDAVVDDTVTARVPSAAAAMGGYEVPFTLLQVLTLMMIIGVMSLAGMLMTDLVRNMWTYSEPAAPVSSLTDSLISLMGWGQ